MNKAAPPQPWPVPDLIGLILFPIAILFILLDILILQGVTYGYERLCAARRDPALEKKPALGWLL